MAWARVGRGSYCGNPPVQVSPSSSLQAVPAHESQVHEAPVPPSTDACLPPEHQEDINVSVPDITSDVTTSEVTSLKDDPTAAASSSMDPHSPVPEPSAMRKPDTNPQHKRQPISGRGQDIRSTAPCDRKLTPNTQPNVTAKRSPIRRSNAAPDAKPKLRGPMRAPKPAHSSPGLHPTPKPHETPTIKDRPTQGTMADPDCSSERIPVHEYSELLTLCCRALRAMSVSELDAAVLKGLSEAGAPANFRASAVQDLLDTFLPPVQRFHVVEHPGT